MRVRRFLTALLLAAAVVPAAGACTINGPGSSTQCDVSGCVVTFERGVEAQVSVLGVDAKLVSVNGSLVTLSVAGQEVTVPVGQTQSAEGLNLTVQEVTDEKVVVQIATGL